MGAHHLLHCICIVTALGFAPHVALSQTDSSSLKIAVDTAWQRSPQARTLEAKRNEVEASREAAQSWIAGSPTLGLGQRTDRWTDRNGIRETEVSMSAPIWLPGQKSARHSLAQTSAEDLDAQLANARLTLAGEVRERLWAVVAAREMVAEAQEHLHHLEGFADEVMRRVKAGDLARADGMLAQQEVLAAKTAVAAAKMRQQEALMNFGNLTGLQDIPTPQVEPIAAAMRELHPKLLAAQTGVQQAQASFDVVNAIRSDSPTVGLSMRQERDANDANSSRTIGVAIQIPLGTRSRNRPLEAAALTQIETAHAQAAQTEATLLAEIRLAKQHLVATQEALDTAKARAALTREHTQLIEKAFRLGERGLADLLRSQALAHEANAAERQQQAALGLAHARLNQALGIVP